MNERMYLHQNIKKLREQFNFSQEQLAEKLNVSAQAVSKWETGESMPSITNLITMSRLFYVSVDALITNINSYQEFEGTTGNVNFKLKQVYYRYNRGESVAGEIDDIVAIILPLSSTDHDYYWVLSSRIIVKAIIYAMLEDKSIDEKHFNTRKIKEILQFATLDSNERRKKIEEYFANKSQKCKELINVYLGSATSTASSIMGHVITFLNMLND